MEAIPILSSLRRNGTLIPQHQESYNDGITCARSFNEITRNLERRSESHPMVTLIPSLGSARFDARGELRLAERLKDFLEDNVWVWHNIPVGPLT